MLRFLQSQRKPFFYHRCTQIKEDKNGDKKIIKKYPACILFFIGVNLW
jgi:hypothetical protein